MPALRSSAPPPLSAPYFQFNQKPSGLGALDPARGTRRYAPGARNAPLNAGILPALISLSNARQEQACVPTGSIFKIEELVCGQDARVPRGVPENCSPREVGGDWIGFHAAGKRRAGRMPAFPGRAVARKKGRNIRDQGTRLRAKARSSRPKRDARVLRRVPRAATRPARGTRR